MILGIECTAHTFGVAVVEDGKILSNVRDMYKPEEGGIIPMESAKHHRDVAEIVYKEALRKAGVSEKDIEAIAVSNAPGLAPCLIEGLKFAKEKAMELSHKSNQFNQPINNNNNKSNAQPSQGNLDNSFENISHSNTQVDMIESDEVDNQGNGNDDGGDNNLGGIGVGRDQNQLMKKQRTIPIISVNHCIAHLEIGRSEGARDPVLLYASGANTQVIAFAAGKYRVFGETLDMGIGNFLDSFARYCGIAFPGGPELEKKAKQSTQNLIDLPYSIKGMDVSFSGMLTKLKQLYDKDYKIEDLSYSMQEHAFAMLVEAAERALAHTGKRELVLGGGVACNKRLQEMCRIMCKERGSKYFCPSNPLLIDNAAMIGFTGELMFEILKENKKLINNKKSDIKSTKSDSYGSFRGGGCGKNNKAIYFLGEFDKLDIAPRERTDDVEVFWR